MENRYDFMEWLGPDTSTTVFMCLDDPADIARVCSVSRQWRRFVITNGFYKKMCIRLCPEASNVARIEVNSSSGLVESGSNNSVDWESLYREHRTYASLIHCLIFPATKKEVMLESISASSTDNYPDESIENTLEPNEQVDRRPSYWSSGGSGDPRAPETLTYRLRSKLCIIQEVKVRPFQAFFQYGHPIYSAKAVRFRMGHSKQEINFTQSSIRDTNITYCNSGQPDDYVWTYISPVFPMTQENALQVFRLPRPALCIGGIVQIELLGRVQQQEMDSLYYVCVCHVKVVGCPLNPKFDVDILDAAGRLVLKYFPEAYLPEDAASVEENSRPSGWHAFADRIRQMRAGGAWNHVLLNALLGNMPPEVDESGDELYE